MFRQDGLAPVDRQSIDSVNLHLVWRVGATQRYLFGARSTPGTEHGAIARLRNRLVSVDGSNRDHHFLSQLHVVELLELVQKMTKSRRRESLQYRYACIFSAGTLEIR